MSEALGQGLLDALLALKLAGRPLSNATAGPLTWRVWMNKRQTGAGGRKE